jgi:hypothetical protein
MSQSSKSAWTLVVAALLGCGGNRPLETIEPIPGSREGGVAGTIQPIDSAAGTIRPIEGAAGTIQPIEGAAGTIQPLGREAPAGEIVPRGDGRPTIQPRSGREIERRRGRDAESNEVVPVDGTRWVGTNHEGALTLEFLVGGILRYTTPNGTWTNGTWTQTANDLSFEMNSRYAEYTGRIRGTTMSGTGRNRSGVRWEWEAARQ